MQQFAYQPQVVCHKRQGGAKRILEVGLKGHVGTDKMDTQTATRSFTSDLGLKLRRSTDTN